MNLVEHHCDEFLAMRENCMVQDVSWKGPGEVWGATLSGLWGSS